MIDPRRRTVLHLNRSSFLGGVERVILTLLPALETAGFKTILGCPSQGELVNRALEAGITVSRLDIDRMRGTLSPKRLLQYFIKLKYGSDQILDLCKREDICLVHVHHPVGALYAAHACKSLKLPLILHVHETEPASLLYRAALIKASATVSQYICVSKSAEKLVKAVLGKQVPTTIVYNGIDEAFVRGSYTPAPDVVGPGPHFAVFGVIEPRKGQEVFLKAAIKIAALNPDARFWIVGPLALKDKTFYLKRLELLANSKALAGSVHFTGYRSDVAELMSAMSVVVLPSIAHESFGMVIVEALTLGRPAVASAIGGITEIIADGETGFLVSPNDVEELSQAMQRALGSEGQRCGDTAKAEMRLRFSLLGFKQNIVRVYDALMMEFSASDSLK